MSERLTKVKFTNLDKVLYPELRITKAQVIEYYIKMAPKMLGILSKRAISLKRFPDGVEKEGFFEKYIEGKKQEWDSYRLQVTEWEKNRYLKI